MNAYINRRVKLAFEIKELEKQLAEYQDKNKELFLYNLENQDYIKALRNKLSQLELDKSEINSASSSKKLALAKVSLVTILIKYNNYKFE